MIFVISLLWVPRKETEPPSPVGILPVETLNCVPKAGAGVDAITGGTDVDKSIPRIEVINGKPVDVHSALDVHEQTEVPIFKALVASGVKPS
jgi:hypothetical protein